MEQICNGCGAHPAAMATVTMSAAGWELNEERHSREKKWLCIIIIVLIVALVSSNLAWIVYESQYEIIDKSATYDIDQQADNGGDNNTIIGDGGIINGEAKN